jgi:four helix bundle protein
MQDYDEQFSATIVKRCYDYSARVVRLIDGLDKGELSSQIIATQLLRSAVSIGANVVEAQTASSKRDFIDFLDRSRKAAYESKQWLALLRDTGKADTKAVSEILEETENIGNILALSVRELKGNE